MTNSNKMTKDYRASVTIIVCPVRGNTAIHFCAIHSLQGSDCELWWPVVAGTSLHEAVEAIMVTNGIAINVTRVDKVRMQGRSTDYQVTYNRMQ